MQKTFVVPEKGRGRPDYSSSVHYASYATAKGFQARFHLMAEYTDFDTLSWPDFYVSLFVFYDLEHKLTYPAPKIPYYIYSEKVSCESNALVFLGLYRFNSYADIWAWNVDKWYGDIFGHGKAELAYSKGIKTAEGKWYVDAFTQYSENPKFSMDKTVHMLCEEVFY